MSPRQEIICHNDYILLVVSISMCPNTQAAHNAKGNLWFHAPNRTRWIVWKWHCRVPTLCLWGLCKFGYVVMETSWHKTIEMLSKPGSCGRAREWRRLGVEPLTQLLSNKWLGEVPFVELLCTSPNRMLLSNQNKGSTPSLAHSLVLPHDPGLHNLTNVFSTGIVNFDAHFSFQFQYGNRCIIWDMLL